METNEEQKRESSVIKCTFCSKVVTRYLAGRYPNGKDKKWVDEKGREFSGRTCPPCHVQRVARKKNKNFKAKLWG